MNILVIGGAGFIGCNIANYYLSKGDKVTVFDNLSRAGTAKNLEWLAGNSPQLQFVHGDIRGDLYKLQKAVDKANVVFHTAAQVAASTSMEDPVEDFSVNALGTLNILEAIRKSDSNPVLIYTSTNKVYGQLESVPAVERETRYEFDDHPNGIAEDYPLDFHAPYGCSKGAGDQYVRDYARIYGVHSVVFRQSCIYGERQFGNEDQGWVAWFIIAALQGRPITIYGDGKQVRDCLYVGDLIQAFELAINNIDKAQGQIYNIGGGPKNTTSLLELLADLEKRFEKKIPVKYDAWRLGDQKVYVSDISKVKKELGWWPKTDLPTGLDRLSRWVQRELMA
ncbi:MAG: NAD-dependent epimerase/dehydratase family protein [Dehalococcoidia bacterium]